MIIRFRSTSFPLAIQVGRCSKHRVPRSQRLCKACNLHCTEDDKHFLLECPAYNHIRQRYATIFTPTASPASILNTCNQGLLGQALKVMLAHRAGMTWASCCDNQITVLIFLINCFTCTNISSSIWWHPSYLHLVRSHMMHVSEREPSCFTECAEINQCNSMDAPPKNIWY